MSKFSDILDRNIEAGLKGENKDIPTLLSGFDSVTGGTRRSTYTLVGANTGVGKTAFVDQSYIIVPYLLYIRNFTEFKIDCDYFSLEISLKRKVIKWASLLLYYYHGIIVPPDDLLSMKKNILGKDVFDKVKDVYDLLDGIGDHVRIRDKRINPTGITKIVQEVHKQRGEIKEITSSVNGITNTNRTFITKPEYKNYIHLSVVDHIGKLRLEHEKEHLLNKKQTIDKFSSYACEDRDLYGSSTIAISQFNRDLADISRQRFKELTPNLEDFKESGNPAEDADLVVAMFSPIRYNIERYKGYPSNVIGKKTRFGFILKNRDGDDAAFFGLKFIGEVGYFQKLENKEYFEEKINAEIFMRDNNIKYNILKKLFQIEDYQY